MPIPSSIAAFGESISVGQQQRVEILKALYRGADILILDEPTAVLTPQEAEDLFVVIESLKQQGKSVVFISHKLNEVLAIADRISVLRRGKLVETRPRSASVSCPSASASRSTRASGSRTSPSASSSASRS